MRTKQKILQLSKDRLKVISFAIFFNVLLAGSVCGTFAWYAYATRTGIEEYHGVTVGTTGSLEIGLVSSVELSECSQYSLREDKETLVDEDKIIYWCEKNIDSRTINYVVSANGSATNTMHPVTTGSNDVFDPDNFHLFRAPAALYDYTLDESSYAEKEDYVHIPFVFRFEDENEEMEMEYIANKKVFFTGCEVKTSLDTPDKEVYKAVRLFAKNKTNGFIINPTADVDGSNNVGGILDLNGDGFYDYNLDGYEYIYGESQSYNYNDFVTESDGTLPNEERTTFVANHKKDKYALNEETYVPKTISYNCMEAFADKSQFIAITDADYHYLATLDMYVYAEGWDLHVIDEEDGSGFDMKITFEVEL